MINKLKELIASDLINKENAHYESTIEGYNKEKEELSNQLNSIKHNYKGNNRFKIFISNYKNHGLIPSCKKTFLKIIPPFLLNIAAISFLLFYLYLFRDAINIVGFKAVPIFIIAATFLIFIVLGLVIIGTSICICYTLFVESPNKIHEYMEIEAINNLIEINEKNHIEIIKNISNFKHYDNDPVSKEVLKEAFYVLSEDSIKPLLNLEDGVSIRYCDLIDKISEIEDEKLSEAYEKVKRNI